MATGKDQKPQPPSTSRSLVKEHLADELKHAIPDETLAPGQRVIEAKWARQFGMAQASVRDGIKHVNHV